MMSCAELKNLACQTIDEAATNLNDLSQLIWKNPELCFEERFAHKTLTEFLDSNGFPVERNFVLDTGFRSVYSTSSGPGDDRPNVAVLCEYDALPEIGHACGHNLIAEVGVGAALGIKAALDAAKDAGKDIGTLTVLGTPAEESGCGKGYMIDAGVFDSVDVAMMAHAASVNQLQTGVLARWACEVTYEGKASHAAAFPWEGVNALDAAVMAYSSISVLRQQMKPTWRIHGIIASGGAKPNIIPEKTSMEYYIRAPNMKDLYLLKEKVSACFEAAAVATGCEVSVKWDPKRYENLVNNNTLVGLFQENAHGLGFEVVDTRPSMSGGSTDMGNVSHLVPSIHPFFNIGDGALHTRQFAEIAGNPNAQPYAITIAKSIAMTAIDVYCKPHMVEKLRAELDEDIKKE